MRIDKKQVLSLRKQGKSYAEIKDALNIPKSTLSGWLRPYKWSENIKKTLTEQSKEKSIIRIRALNKTRGAHLQRVYQDARNEAKIEFQKLKYHPLFIAGLMLYWGEGEKISRNHVRITNVDSKMIRLFLNFLINICQIDKKKIRANIFIYKDLNGDTCRKYWIQNAGLLAEQFTKDIVLPSRHLTKRVPQGVCTITVSSSYLKEKMLTWLDLISEELASSEYYKYKRD